MPVVCAGLDGLSVSEIEREKLIEDVYGEEPAKEVADRYSIVGATIPPNPGVVDIRPHSSMERFHTVMTMLAIRGNRTTLLPDSG